MSGIANYLANAKVASLLPAANRNAGTANGTGVDISAADGIGLLILDETLVSGTGTCDVKLQECDTVGGTYTDVANGAIAQQNATALKTLAVDLSVVKKFVRAVAVTAGSTPVYGIAVDLVYQSKY